MSVHLNKPKNTPNECTYAIIFQCFDVKMMIKYMKYKHKLVYKCYFK